MARLLLRDLVPGTQYKVQVRAKNDEMTSEWSQIFFIQTVADAVAPAPITGLSWTSVGTAFKGTWTAPTLNADGSTLSDFADFKVTIYSSAAPATTATYYVTEPRFDLSFEQNVNALGTPRASVTIEVRARDHSGNESTVVSATASNPAPATPANLAGTATYDSIAVKWDRVADTDLKYYELYTNATNSNSGGSLVYRGADNTYTHTTVAYSTDVYFYVLAVDVFNTASTASSAIGPFRPKNASTVDVTAPAAPTSVATTSAVDANNPYGLGAYIDVTWAANSESDLDGYKLRYSQSSSGPWDYIDVPNGVTTARINFLEPNKNYYVALQAFDFSGNKSAFTNSSTYPQLTAKDSSVPAAPGTITLTGFTTSFNATWPANSEVDVADGHGYYAFDYSTSPTFASGVTTRNVVQPMINVNGLTTGNTYYCRVRAVDASGNASTNSATANITLGSPASYTSDGAAPGSSPTPTVNPLYQALEVRWAATSNADPVTYEVHLSTTTGFTPSGATKCLEVDGTYAVIKSLPGSSTGLSYGTTYFVKLITKDRDGSAAAGTQASGIPLQVDNGDIAANAVRANQIQAGSVTTEKLTVGSLGTGLNKNGGFEEADSAGTFAATYTTSSGATRVTSNSRSGTAAVSLPNSASVGLQSDKFPVSPNDVLSVSIWAKSGTANASGFTLRVSWRDSSDAQLSTSNIVSNVATTTSYQQFAGQVTAPASAAYVRVQVLNNGGTNPVFIDDLDIRYPSSSTQIADGAITTNHMTANSINADRLTVGTLNGDRIIANSVDAGTLKAGTAIAQNLTVTSTLTLGTSGGGPGTIQSFDYNGSTLGFKLTSNGLDIRNGTIYAKALQIQEGENIVLPQYADFEHRTDYYVAGTTIAGTATGVSAVATASKFNTQSLQFNANGTVYLGTSTTNYNITLEPSTTYIVSYYGRFASGAATLTPSVTTNTPTTFNGSAQAQTGSFTRYSFSFTTGAGDNSGILWFTASGAGVAQIDGLQIEKQFGGLTTPGEWNPPGYTKIDGASIRTGSIQSTALSTVGDTTQPAWSINTTGSAQLNDVIVRGKIVVGASGNAFNSSIALASWNYGGSGAQWSIFGDGTFSLKSGSTGSTVTLANTGLTGNDGTGTTYNAGRPTGETFALLSTGALYLAGTINAQSGVFTGDVQITSTGSLFAGNSSSSGKRLKLDSTAVKVYTAAATNLCENPQSQDVYSVTNCKAWNDVGMTYQFCPSIGVGPGTNGSDSYALSHFTTNSFGFAAGSYTASVYVYCNVDCYTRLGVQGTNLYEGTLTFIPARTWTRVWVTATTSGTIDHFVLRPPTNSSGGTNYTITQKIWYAGFQLETAQGDNLPTSLILKNMRDVTTSTNANSGKDQHTRAANSVVASINNDGTGQMAGTIHQASIFDGILLGGLYGSILQDNYATSTSGGTTINDQYSWVFDGSGVHVVGTGPVQQAGQTAHNQYKSQLTISQSSPGTVSGVTSQQWLTVLQGAQPAGWGGSFTPKLELQSYGMGYVVGTGAVFDNNNKGWAYLYSPGYVKIEAYDSVQLLATSSTGFVQITAPGLKINGTDILDTWTTFSPTFSGTGWAIGNATKDCSWLQIGKTVFYRIFITTGSTTTYGSTSLDIVLTGLPAPRAGRNMASGTYVSGGLTGAYAYNSGGAAWLRPHYLNANNQISGLTSTSIATASVKGSAAASGDQIYLTGWYEAA